MFKEIQVGSVVFSVVELVVIVATVAIMASLLVPHIGP